MIPRFDLTYSYWIYVWYLLYIFHIISYNPKVFIIIALFLNSIYIFFMIYYKNYLLYIFLFIIVNLIIKVIPLWTIRNTSIKFKDIIAGTCLYMIYLWWLWINNDLNKNFFSNIYYSIKNNTTFTPFVYYSVLVINILTK